MPQHLSQELAERYRRRTLSKPELIAADDHLASCAECRDMMGSQEDFSPRIDSLQADLAKYLELEHVDYDQLEAYVDRRLGPEEREGLDSHFKVCPSCSEELRDLQVFKDQLGKHEVLELGGAAATTASSVRTPRKRLAWEFPGAWRISTRWAFAACAVVSLALGLRWAWVWQHKGNTVVQKPQTILGIPGLTSSEAPRSPDVAQTSFSYLPPELQAIVANAIETQHIQTPHGLGELAVLRHYAEHFHTPDGLGEPAVAGRRGYIGDTAFPLLSPIETFVYNTKPVFLWEAIPNAEGYRVRVSNAEGNPVESSPVLTARSWKSTVVLGRGEVYLWRVAIIRDGVEVESTLDLVQGRFRVLDETQSRQLQQLKHTHPQEHFGRGVLLAHAGVLEEARQEFSVVPTSDPNYELAQKFNRQLQLHRQTKGGLGHR